MIMPVQTHYSEKIEQKTSVWACQTIFDARQFSLFDGQWRCGMSTQAETRSPRVRATECIFAKKGLLYVY